MLKELRIKNLAIIDDLTVRFDRGLNVLTGETGAGKSIIVDALGLALGERAQSELIRAGEKEASVQAFFELDDYRSMPDIGIDTSDGLLLRRVLSAGSKSRAYINDTMVTLQTLSEAGKSIVDILSQHEHQSLLSSDRQRALIDSYGKLQDDREKVERLFSQVRDLTAQVRDLKARMKERAHRLDLLRFQVNEIDAASLNPGEKEALSDERLILSNLSRLNELTAASYALLHEDDGSCSEKLAAVIGHLREMQTVDSSIEETLKILESALPLIEDAAISLRSCRDRYDLEPDRLELVEDRLELIRNLERKYGEGTEAILSYRNQAAQEMNGLESADERLADLEKELGDKEADLLKAAVALSEKRKRTARKIEGLIVRNLADLAFSSAAFRVDITQETDDNGSVRMTSAGLDRVEFLFSANAGEPVKPLAKIASGGELSRVMLSLKSALADVDNLPVLIFDEVDAGIGGKTAESVGKKLDMISGTHQLLCITHLPQIARYADVHLRIEKREKGNRVYVEVRELSGNERRDEIARMLSGKITDISLKHAGELLERTR